MPWAAEKGTEEEIKFFRNDSVGTAVFSDSSTCAKSDFHWNQNINLLIFFFTDLTVLGTRHRVTCVLQLEKDEIFTSFVCGPQ